MSWNYRLVEYADGTGFGIHEVYYDENGEAKQMTVEPVRLVAESEAAVRELVLLSHHDCARRPIFKEPSDWSE